MKPILKYPGAKWRLMPAIAPYVPKVRRVLDAYCGSGAFALLLTQKYQPDHLILNDRDERIAALFRVMRDRPSALMRAVTFTPWSRSEYLAVTTTDGDIVLTGDPVEDARRFLVLTWMQHGTKMVHRGGFRHKGLADRAPTYEIWAQLPDRIATVAMVLRACEVEALPALTLIGRYSTPDTLIYADPPYVRQNAYGTRRLMYRYEMTESDHRELLTALQTHPGPVLLSGYQTDLYDTLLSDWRRVDIAATAEKGKARTECLWINKATQQALGNGVLFDETREG